MRNQAQGSTLSPTSTYTGAPSLQQWEYKTLVLEAKKMNDPRYVDPLDDLGLDGWELVSMTPYDLTSKYMAFAFKRARH